MEKMTHAEYVAGQRDRAVTLAKRVVAGSPDILEALQELERLQVEVPEDDPDFLVIRGIADDLESLPIGRQRALWAEEALRAKAAEIAATEVWAKEGARNACLSIIRRFTTG